MESTSFELSEGWRVHTDRWPVYFSHPELGTVHTDFEGGWHHSNNPCRSFKTAQEAMRYKP